MMRTNLLLLGLGVLGAIGCGAGGSSPAVSRDGGADAHVDPLPVDQPTTARKSAQFAGDIIRQLGGALSFSTGEGSVLSRLAGGLTGARQSETAQALPGPLPAPILDRLWETPAFKSLRPRPSFLVLASEEENVDETAGDVEALLETRLFAAGNVESTDATSTTYLLKGDPTCRPLPSEIASGRVDRVDLRCSADLAKLQVRIVVTSDGDGYRFQILLGPDRLELSVLVIHSDLLAWEADLDMARQATAFANMALQGEGERRDEPFPFAVLQGRIRFAVQKLGEEKASLRWSVLEALDIQDRENHAFAMKAADPVFALTGDGVAKTVTLQLAIPQVDVRAPWDPRDLGADNRDLHVSVGGLHGAMTLSEAAEELAFQGLGLGPSFVAVRAARIFELAFNPGQNNRMDLTIAPIAGDQARFTLTPRFDLGLTFGLQHVAGDFEEAPDAHLQGQTYGVLAAPAAGGARVVLETVAESDTFAGGLELVEGTLKLSTSADAAATVEVSPGACLTENPTPADGAHPLLGSLMSAPCP